jgi:hypothetical protein
MFYVTISVSICVIGSTDIDPLDRRSLTVYIRQDRNETSDTVCTGRTFRISPGPARGPFGHSPKFIFKFVTRIPPKPDFLFFQPEWNQIYLKSALTLVSLIPFSFSS